MKNYKSYETSTNVTNNKTKADHKKYIKEEGFECEICKMGLFAAKAAFDNQLVFGIIKNFFSDQLCPLVVTDTSVCWGGSNIIGGELLNVIAKSFFDPLYFCEDIIPVCRNDEFKFYHAESYANRILSTKPEILK